MSRRHRAEKRVILPDAKFNDLVLAKFMNAIMLDGKKSTAEKIVYGAMDIVEDKAKTESIRVFHDALENIKPAIERFTDYPGDRTSQNEDYVHLVSEQNVRMTIEYIRNNSMILSGMEQNGEIRIVGAMYDMDTAVVTFYDH